jgi:hypothetical protein
MVPLTDPIQREAPGVRAAVSDGAAGTVRVEDADGAALHLHDFPPPGRKVGNLSDDVFSHNLEFPSPFRIPGNPRSGS